jgi:hypothetical protein
MDEAEWLVSENPAAMLSYLRGPDVSQMHLPAGRRVGRSYRKLRLWVEACQFRVYPAAHWGDVNDLIIHDWGRPNGWLAECPLAWRAAALRCVVGNPFRLVVWWDARCPNGTRFAPTHLWQDGHCLACGFPGRTAVSLARRAYDDRDFAALPVLADALEEAGCREESILRHLRLGGPHVRGCHVLDLVLGKE